MRMTFLCGGLIKVVRTLVNFKKPIFESFDCIDVIIDDKPLFLLAWGIKHGYKLRLKNIKKTYRRSEGSAIVKLPHNRNDIVIEALSHWRKTTIHIPLVNYHLDAVTAHKLIRTFKPFNKYYLANQVEVQRSAIELIRIDIGIKKTNIAISKQNISILTICEINKNEIQFPHL